MEKQSLHRIDHSTDAPDSLSPSLSLSLYIYIYICPVCSPVPWTRLSWRCPPFVRLSGGQGSWSASPRDGPPVPQTRRGPCSREGLGPAGATDTPRLQPTSATPPAGHVASMTRGREYIAAPICQIKGAVACMCTLCFSYSRRSTTTRPPLLLFPKLLPWHSPSRKRPY
jgi:hypothetical protein